MRLVIFDIDGTLVAGASSEIRFARYLWRKRELGLAQLGAFATFCLRYLPRFGRHVLEKNKAYLCGHDVAHIERLARAFVADDLCDALHTPALERLRAHQAAGDHVVLLSGTPQFLAEALGETLGAAHSVGARCHTRGDPAGARFTARAPCTHPYGPSKIDAALGLARAAGLPLSRAIAYGDSIHDAFLFRVVGEVVLVAPDRRLSAAATGAGWKVLLDRADRA